MEKIIPFTKQLLGVSVSFQNWIWLFGHHATVYKGKGVFF